MYIFFYVCSSESACTGYVVIFGRVWFLGTHLVIEQWLRFVNYVFLSILSSIIQKNKGLRQNPFSEYNKKKKRIKDKVYT